MTARFPGLPQSLVLGEGAFIPEELQGKLYNNGSARTA